MKVEARRTNEEIKKEHKEKQRKVQSKAGQWHVSRFECLCCCWRVRRSYDSVVGGNSFTWELTNNPPVFEMLFLKLNQAKCLKQQYKRVPMMVVVVGILL